MDRHQPASLSRAPETEESSLPEDRRSALAKRVADLKASTLEAVAKRERLPQPLFWSLFSSRLNDIKKDKEKSRSLAELFES